MLDIKVQLTDNIKGRIELNNYKSNSIMNNFQAISESRRKKKLLVVVMRIDLTNTSRKKQN